MKEDAVPTEFDHSVSSKSNRKRPASQRRENESAKKEVWYFTFLAQCDPENGPHKDINIFPKFSQPFLAYACQVVKTPAFRELSSSKSEALSTHLFILILIYLFVHLISKAIQVTIS